MNEMVRWYALLVYLQYGMWHTNVFVKDGHVSGIIDWERSVWGEAFMDDRFRYHNRGEAFMRAYIQEFMLEWDGKDGLVRIV